MLTVESVKKFEKTPVAEQVVQPGQRVGNKTVGKPVAQGEAPPPLTDRQRLEGQEEIFEQYIGWSMKGGMALTVINEQRLYRVAGYTSFDVYCKEKWDMDDAYAYRLMAAAACVDMLQKALSPIGETRFPTNESQVRPLTRLEPEKQVEAWKRVLEDYKGKPITAVEVEAVVDNMLGKPGKEKTAKSKTGSKRAEQKLVKIGEVVASALKKSDADLTVAKLKKTLEEIQKLIGTKK